MTSDEIRPAKTLLLETIDYTVIEKVEVAVAAIVIPSVEVRVSAGLHVPCAPAIGITGVCLIGAR